MALIDEVRGVCERLAPAGWGELLDGHGLDVRAEDLRAELLRELPAIDRGLPGFEDFAAEGRRAIEPGRPDQSLLLHALASPNVLRAPGGHELEAFPTIAEIDAVENLVFGIRPPSLRALMGRFSGTMMAVAVFACEYRPGAETVHRRHADLCFARTGVARVGTAEAQYDAPARGFTPFVEDNDHGIRVLPARYAAYLAVHLTGEQDRFGPMNFNIRRRLPIEEPGDDGMRLFWVPVHKLFPGAECLRGLELSVALEAHHLNEKLRRIHREFRRRGHDGGWGTPDIDRPPFAFSEGIASLSPAAGPGVLVPTVHSRLVEPAIRGGKPLTYRVPPNPENSWAPSLLIQADEGRYRHAPEYVHGRHAVGGNGEARDLGDEEDVAEHVRRGGYHARHYLDFTGDGWVEALCPELATEVPRSVPAYSLVTAPDFFPHCNQRELIEWWTQRVPTALRRRIWHEPPPLTLADERLPPNVQLPEADFRPEDDTVSAIVSLPGDGRARRPLVGPTTARHPHLPDAAASVFAPGWDTSQDRTGSIVHLASYGLGSPFPEDAKLCAALSSFWPAAAPDAGRSFSTPFPTATPMTDEEIGVVGDLPWDGVPGPRPTAGGQPGAVDYASFDHVDYVRSALEGRFSLALTGQVDTAEYMARILAMARAYAGLGVDPSRPLAGRPRDRGWSVVSFHAASEEDQELREAEAEARAKLSGARYRVGFGLRGSARRDPADHRTVQVTMVERATVFVGALPRVLVKRADAAWRLVRPR